ncbi:cupin domain-containing protein [Mycetocola lacteus]|uniref:glucose-6-phosphate isomerase n=1 Tax=Mycetocola lacteus TaxID=76637 RepID=A0A3L7AS13_9MICO|nr:glucose-6-phosphate isomerase family protein [Mycetocola lacteus]RLP83216.1 cupin domain-containing protein [Mycetocola lacteus]
MSISVDIPVPLRVHPNGDLTGNTRRYEKFLGDMAGVYRDDAAYRAAVEKHGADTLVYSVEEHRYSDEEGALVIGTSTLLPGTYGTEFAVTRGHIHAVENRAELYYCLAGHGVMLLETIDGQSAAVELTPGEAVNVPGHWIHRSINVGTEPFVTLFTYAADAGQDYAIIGDAAGMKELVVTDGHGGWASVANPEHTGYRVDVNA